MTSVREWLHGVGLGELSEQFELHQIDLDAVRYLSDAEFKELGLSMGARLKLKAAIQALKDQPAVASEGSVYRAPTGSAERRQLTVLFCDLIGSTELSRRLDPEDYRELIRTYQSACAEVVSRFDGYIAQYLGDGLLVYFGYPKAHEDDAQRAVRTGLGLIEAVSASKLSVRVGIDTGLVVVGDVGSGSSQEQLALGDTPNIAARLQGVAQPNAVVLSEHTRLLTAGAFEYRDLGSQVIKGVSEAVRAWQALAPSLAESRFEAATGGLPAPMVGRELEFAVLLHAWQRAKSGKGQLVLLCGEPGIGKSRIVRALRQDLSGKGVTPWQYQCSTYFANSALYPIIEGLKRSLDFGRDDSLEQKLDKLERFLSRYGRPSLDVNLIGRVLSLPAEVRYGALSMTPQKQKEEMLRALSDVIDAAAKTQPGLLLLEDIHWADQTTLEWIEALLARLDHMSLLLVATYRPEFKPQWVGQPLVTTLTLGRLDAEQTRAISERITRGDVLPDEIIAHIVAKTDGIPLFVEELTKAILESGLLKRTHKGYELPGPLPALAIPATLRDSLMGRLDRLTPVKEVAQIGACIGREFGEELLTELSPLPAAELHAALHQLVESELVFRRGERPHNAYVFKHALIQEAAYDSLLKARRIQIHAQIAKILEEQFQELVATQPERLAHHYTSAAMPENAIPYWRKAGELALQRMAAGDAIAHLDRGMGLLQQLAVSPNRDAHELELCTTLATAWIALQGWAHSNVVRNYDRAWQLAQSLNRTDHSLRILYGQWMIRLGTGRNRESVPWVELLLNEGKRDNRDDLTLAGHCAAANTYFFLGDFNRVIQHTQAILADYDPALHGYIVDQWNFDPKTYAGVYEALAYWMLGYPDRPVSTAEHAIQHGRARGHPFNLGWALQFTAKHLDVYRREPDSCATRLDEYERLAREQRIEFFEHIAGPICRAAWLLISDRPQEAQALFAESIPRWVAVGLETDVPYFKTLHAQSAALSGQLDLALKIVEEALEQIARPGWEERGFIAEALRVKGWILHLDGDLEGAEGEFRASLDASREQHAKSWELRTATSYAELLKNQGRRREALDLLKPIYDWFTEGRSTRDHLDAAALLADLP